VIPTGIAGKRALELGLSHTAEELEMCPKPEHQKE
jgi:hypothetical protein